MNQLKQDILHKIETGEVAMRPYWQFLLLGVLLLTSGLFLFLTAIYALSLVGYLLSLSGASAASQFGVAGVGVLLLALPWRLVLLSLVILVVLYVLVKRFSFAHQKPFLYSIVGVTVLVVGSSVLVAQTTAHERLHEVSQNQAAPLATLLYQAGDTPRELTFGTLTEATDFGYQLTTIDGQTLTVETTEVTRLLHELTLGSQVVVLGERIENTITARGIRLAPKAHDRLKKRFDERAGDRARKPASASSLYNVRPVADGSATTSRPLPRSAGEELLPTHPLPFPSAVIESQRVRPAFRE